MAKYFVCRKCGQDRRIPDTANAPRHCRQAMDLVGETAATVVDRQYYRHHFRPYFDREQQSFFRTWEDRDRAITKTRAEMAAKGLDYVEF